MNKLLNTLSKFIFPLLILFLIVILAWKNYIPGTFLSGWDTLHPEFNFSLYLKRIFWGVWQEHQGVGAVASQAHASELSKFLILYPLSLVFPLSFLRYAFFFLTIILGSLGVYFLTLYLLAREKIGYIKPAAFLAAIFYVLNLATLQQYYVPLEMFAVHFASLPWLLLFAIKYLREGKKTNLLVFCFVTLFSSSMAHTATLFYVYFASLCLFLGGVFIFSRRLYVFKRSILLVFLTFCLNTFWLLPNIYYIFNHSKEVENSKISTIFSDEAYLQGKSFGNIKDLSLLKNFLFNWRKFDTKNNTFVDLTQGWVEHFQKPGVAQIAYGFFVLSLVGILIAIVRKSKYVAAFIPILSISIFFWINSNPPFEKIFGYLRTNLDLFREGLRFPFTKFSILLTICLSVFLSYSAQFVMEKLKKIKLSYVFFVILFLANLYLMLPSFKGDFISPSMKVKIPNEYFQVFEWFKTKDSSTKIAKLPVQTFWGWNFYSWDYQGAGFTWFGIPQATFDREFDRWSPFNETFYNQLSFALYSTNLQEFENTLQKYQITYLLLDESVLNAGGNSKLLYITEIKDLLSKSVHIKEVEKFGFMTIYETDWDFGNTFVSTPKSYTKINSDVTYSQIDPIYTKFGNYVYDFKAGYYPFENYDQRGDVKISIFENNVVFKNTSKDVKASFPIKDEIIENFSDKRGFSEGYNCDLKKIGSVSKENFGDRIVYKASGGGVSCDFFLYQDLDYSEGYVLRIKGQNIKGRSLKIYLQNIQTSRLDLEELLAKGSFDNYFVVLPTKLQSKGFTLNLETRSFGNASSENILEKIEIIPFDANLLTSLVSKSSDIVTLENKISVKNVNKIGTGYYSLDADGSGLVVLGQGYEKGWIAFGNKISNKSILEHTKVNSWANGWIVPTGVNKIYIFFWPQLLEWAGMLLGLTSLLFVLLTREVKHT